MIIRGLLLEAAANAEGASEMWRNVLAAPSANDDQVRTARMRLDAISAGEPGGGERAAPP